MERSGVPGGPPVSSPQKRRRLCIAKLRAGFERGPRGRGRGGRRVPVGSAHVVAQSVVAPSLVSERARLEREDVGQGPHIGGGHGLPRPRGFRRRAREGVRSGQGGRRPACGGLAGRHRAVRPPQRVGLAMDRVRPDRGRRAGARAAELRHAPQGRVGRPGGGSRPRADPTRAPGRPAPRPPRNRGADRDCSGPARGGVDLWRVAPARDDHPRPGRHGGIDGDACAHRRGADPRVPRRSLPPRVRVAADRRPGARPPGDRRAVPQDPRPRRVARLRQPHPAAGLRRQVGGAPRPDRSHQRAVLTDAGSVRPSH
jgi:hypothetical protein